MTLTISLADDLAKFVKSKVDAGEYPSSADVVRDALERLAANDRHSAEDLERLRAAWNEGIASDDYAPLNLSQLTEEARQRRQAAKD